MKSSILNSKLIPEKNNFLNDLMIKSNLTTAVITGGITTIIFFLNFIRKKYNHNHHHGNDENINTSLPIDIDLKKKSVQKEITKKIKLKDQQMRQFNNNKEIKLNNNDNNNNNNGKKNRMGNNELPDGQVLVKKWIVLDLGVQPSLKDYNPWKEKEKFKISIKGLIEKEIDLTVEVSYFSFLL